MGAHWLSLWSLAILPIGLMTASGLWRAGAVEQDVADLISTLSISAAIMLRFLLALYGLVVAVRDLSAHRATLPVTDKQLAMGQLRAVANGVLLTLLTCTGCLLAGFVWHHGFRGGSVGWNIGALDLHWYFVVWAFTLMLATLVHWTLHGLAWTITDCYRCYRAGFLIAAALSTLVLGMLIVTTVVIKDAPDAQQWVQAMWSVAGAIFGLLCLGLVVHQYASTVQRGLLASWALVAALSVWLALFGWMWMTGYLGEPVTLTAILFGGGMMSLVTITVPAAMLAVANGRHR